MSTLLRQAADTPHGTVTGTLTDTNTDTAYRVDLTWKGLYRVGGVCLLLTGLIYLIEAPLGMVIGTPPADSTPYLRALADHATLAQWSYALYALTDVLLIPAVLALYLALKGIAKNPILVATALLAAFAVVDVAITEATQLTLVTLTQHAAAATTASQRAAYTAAANFGLAVVPLASFYSWVVSSVGVLIVGVVMLRRRIFTRLTALAGIVSGLVGIVAGFYVLAPSLAMYLTPGLLAFGLWCLLVAVRLLRLPSIGRTDLSKQRV